MVNLLVCGIIVNVFELQLYNYIHFWINTQEKGMNLLIPSQWSIK